MLVGNLTISIFQHWSDVMWMCDAGHLSRRQRVCTVPPTVTKFGELAFSVAGPSVWNSLPADIRHITDTSDFKRRLKAHFFNVYFNT